ncbi:MAG: toll/interleukin-1 receptor domain-containing protein [Cellvibrionales bacterium]|nr:toll/interleukin-1 receptor domain-containing protein [Cellvibrionales bacterium]
MGNSVLVFVSHSSDDKEGYIEPIVQDLEDCFINIWIDKRNILPGDNLRKSIFRDGLDKADIALIFFTEQSLSSSWVDREIKHVLREEAKKGNSFDLKKIISIFDSKATYTAISERYPELTDDLMHLMPKEYTKKDLGQLISAIWSKYLDLQGGDVATQRQLLAKDKEIFQKEKEVQELKEKIQSLKSKSSNSSQDQEFEAYLNSGKVDDLLAQKENILNKMYINKEEVKNVSEAMAFGLLDYQNASMVKLSLKGKEFMKWHILRVSNPS